MTDVGDIAPRSSVAAYYGDDADQYARMATVRNIAAVSTPVRVIKAELDPPFFIEQAVTFVGAVQPIPNRWWRLFSAIIMCRRFIISAPVTIRSRRKSWIFVFRFEPARYCRKRFSASAISFGSILSISFRR
jgi:hypothetical protein